MNNKIGIVAGLIIATLLGAAVAVIGTMYYLKAVQNNNAALPIVQQQVPSEVVTNIPEPVLPVPEVQVPPQVSSEPVKDPGVVWLLQPQKITQDLKLFRLPDSAYEDLPPGVRPPPKGANVEVSYYKTGRDNGNDIIMAIIPPEGPGIDYRAYLRKTSAGTYEYIMQNSDNYDAELKQFISAQPIDAVRINTQTLYASIQTQKTLSYQNVTLANMSSYRSLDLGHRPSPKRTLAIQAPYGPLYSDVQEGPAKGLVTQSFVLVKPNGLEEIYQFEPDALLSDNGVADVTWNDGKKNADSFMMINTTGCGAGPYLPLLNESEISNITPIGKTSGGDNVYGLSNPNDPIIQFLYASTGGAYYGSDGETHKITLKEFQNVHPVFIVQDKLGRYVVYNNSTWGPATECGKPVIYLYPQQPISVAVHVGADITKSEPPYESGWNVFALPDGMIVAHGEKYDSLFWEGMGHGVYPSIERGVIIEKKDVELTLRVHLARLGLTKKETNDFLAFWLPRMPKTSYVRLSWLTTNDMNELAPLEISPKPDTVIRVFLDFEGLQQRSYITPQLFPQAHTRSGFTVVEWGGLLRR